MTRPLAGLGSLTLLALFFLAIPTSSQSSAAVANSAHPFRYDLSRETTISGTVSSVLKTAQPGMIFGSHLLLQTTSGTVDASLGRFAMVGPGALSVSAGQQVTLTGVTNTIKGKPVFLARTVRVGTEVHTIRNERGLEFSPQSRQRDGHGSLLVTKGARP